MEYKIRANNQKEAVEVYKAIRQIQQGKHNIAVNADSRKDTVRIYKEAKRVCDSKKVKDEDYKLMRAIIDICKKYNYYTYGTLEDYNKLLNNADKMDLVDIATNISVHSDENDSRKIEQILKKELGYRGIVKDEKLIDDARIKKNITHASSHAENSKIKDFIVGNMEAYEWWNKHGGTGYWDDDLILEWPLDTKKRATEYFNEMKSALPNVKMHLAKKRGRYVIVFDSKFTDSKLKDFGMHNPATTNYHPEYSPSDFKQYVTNIIKLDLSTKTFTQYNHSKADAIRKLKTYVSQVIEDFKADIANPRVIRNEAVTWYNNNYTKILDTLLKTPSIIQHMDGTSLVKANNLLQQMQQSIK